MDIKPYVPHCFKVDEARLSRWMNRILRDLSQGGKAPYASGFLTSRLEFDSVETYGTDVRSQPGTLMRVTATKRRQNLYLILDRVAETGETVEILRGDTILRITIASPKKKMKRLISRKHH